MEDTVYVPLLAVISVPFTPPKKRWASGRVETCHQIGRHDSCAVPHKVLQTAYSNLVRHSFAGLQRYASTSIPYLLKEGSRVLTAVPYLANKSPARATKRLYR